MKSVSAGRDHCFNRAAGSKDKKVMMQVKEVVVGYDAQAPLGVPLYVCNIVQSP